jgi:predicted PhzF superfamily epimerase YddE/YHI9
MPPLFHVDAFADKPFAGNPAAVCILPAWKDDHWLQGVAGEMNLSETAFLVRRPNHFDLRWFTPGVEVDLCGHATLASAHVLWQQGHATTEEVHFSTRSGILAARRLGDEIELDFPLTPASPAEPPPGLLEALGTFAKSVGKTRFDYLVELESESAVRTAARVARSARYLCEVGRQDPI